ncbi:Transposable element Tc3 transposase [Araneus ventricosus]|uniref:Transposable element Tc3 transposase n=1 Tax=Araneus ventricosus TaxID=182803 RepID=A0A4Y2DA89_ARAVE|nr:Transposable element Tc3 transposase [Araneus ventricosus]GBM13037.1 Transposable element Tc3 transposase [Araneus ventricosus]
MSWTTEWTSVIFSDEKRFNLDGPDGFQYYWHCLKQKEQYYSTRQQGGGSLMVWLAVGFGGRSSLVFIKGRQNHKDYIQHLETELLPYGSDWGGENWIYQQDGASIYTAQGVKKWFDDNNVQVLPWPAESPDLNIVENVWAMLVERVYGQGRQYENVKELHESLDSVHEEIQVVPDRVEFGIQPEEEDADVEMPVYAAVEEDPPVLVAQPSVSVPQRQNLRENLDDFFEELSDGANHPK